MSRKFFFGFLSCLKPKILESRLLERTANNCISPLHANGTLTDWRTDCRYWLTADWLRTNCKRLHIAKSSGLFQTKLPFITDKICVRKKHTPWKPCRTQCVGHRAVKNKIPSLISSVYKILVFQLMSTVIVNLSMLLLPLIDLLLLDLHLQIKTCHRLRLTIKSIMSDGKEAYTDRHVLSRRGLVLARL